MMSKNLLETPIGIKYNINPYPQGINITFEKYLEYLKQKKIIDSLKNFLNELGYTINITDNEFIIERKDICIQCHYEDKVYMEELDNEISINKTS